MRGDLDLHVSYTTLCPEWWRIQIRRRLGKQGQANAVECVNWLRNYGQSEDDNLALEWNQWQQAAEDGEEVAT
jgi:hypothetical protein